MTVAPDAVEAAARALYDLAPWAVSNFGVEAYTWESIGTDNQADYLDQARAALAAAAPLIAQQTLFDAADALLQIRGSSGDKPFLAVTEWLTARAATLAPKEN